jgi:hypothetical protein
MRRDQSRRGAEGAELGPPGRLFSALGKPLAGLALCLMAAGCGSLGPAPGLSPSAGVSVALESIDGLPPETSQKLVHDLDEAAATLRIAVVPAGHEAAYRLRGYLAAHAQGGATSITWAWDVYDGELHRAFRLGGEERIGPTAGGRGSEGSIWGGVDEAVLRRIARAGMEQLAGFIASPPASAAPAAPAPPPARSGQVVASRSDSRSGTAGLPPGQALASFEAATVPLPQRRPAQAGWSGTALIADAAADR